MFKIYGEGVKEGGGCVGSSNLNNKLSIKGFMDGLISWSNFDSYGENGLFSRGDFEGGV